MLLDGLQVRGGAGRGARRLHRRRRPPIATTTTHQAPPPPESSSSSQSSRARCRVFPTAVTGGRGRACGRGRRGRRRCDGGLGGLLGRRGGARHRVPSRRGRAGGRSAATRTTATRTAASTPAPPLGGAVGGAVGGRSVVVERPRSSAAPSSLTPVGAVADLAVWIAHVTYWQSVDRRRRRRARRRRERSFTVDVGDPEVAEVARASDGTAGLHSAHRAGCSGWKPLPDTETVSPPGSTLPVWLTLIPPAAAGPARRPTTAAPSRRRGHRRAGVIATRVAGSQPARFHPAATPQVRKLGSPNQ